MKRIVRLTEKDIRRMVKRVIKESLSDDQYDEMVQKFEEELIDTFYELIKEWCEEVVRENGYENNSGVQDFVSEYAQDKAESWTSSAIELLQSDNWHYPENNFRKLDYVMGEQGIRNFEDLLQHDNAVEIFVDWFTDCHGSYGLKYNFGYDLDDFVGSNEEEEPEDWNERNEHGDFDNLYESYDHEDDDYEEDDNYNLYVEDDIENACSTFGNGPVIINGVLGLWDGKHTIQPTEERDIKTAIYRCIGDDGELTGEEDMNYSEEKVELSVHHHDGVNHFTITHRDQGSLDEAIRRAIRKYLR